MINWLQSNNGRLSQVYFAYFAILGVVSHYLGLYLHSLSLEPVEIGYILAVMTIGRIAGPAIWANISHFTSQPVKRIQIGSLLALVCFSFVFSGHHLFLLMFSLGGFAFFWSAVLPQLEALSQTVLEGSAVAYSRVRIWGSISFILLVVIAGWLFEIFGIAESVEGFTVFLLAMLFLSSFRLPQIDLPKDVSEPTFSIVSKLKEPQILVFITCSFLLQLSFAAYYGFFSIYLTELGYSGYEIGVMIAIGVLAEIGIFWISGKLVNRYSLRTMFIFCLGITSLRWTVLSVAEANFLALFFIQVLHAFSYGLYHVASQKFIHQEFPKQLQAKGQAIYMSLSFGIGGALGNLLAGYSWQYLAQTTYLFAGIVVAVATLIAYKGQTVKG